MMEYYILEGKEVKMVADVLEWSKFYETHNRVVKQTNINGLYISTVFLGLDHNFSTKGDPILFETMIFKDGRDVYQERYSTWDEAFEGHTTLYNMYKF